MGPRMTTNVQYVRLSAIRFRESVAEGTLTGRIGPKSRLSLGTCSPRWVHACLKVQYGVSVPSLLGESVAEGTLTGPATKLGRLVRPDGSRMPKVQYGVSVPSLSVKSVAEGTLTGPEPMIAIISRMPSLSGESVAEGTLTGPSLKSRLSLGVGDPERRNLADCWPRWATHAKVQCGVSVPRFR
ncbi:hypothetical protein DPMN_156080, partial [Dreissena polymorpha]